MKRILIFSLAYFPNHVGGAEVAIKEIVDRLPKGRYEFHMICNRFDSALPRVEHVGNIFVHRIGFTKRHATMTDLRSFPLHFNKYLFQFLAPLYGVFLHFKYRYDGVWAMMAHSCAVPVALFHLLVPKVPFVLTLQEGDPIPEIMAKARFALPLFRQAFTRATVIQTISHYLAGWAKDMGATGPIEVIPNAVDTKHFSQIYPHEELDALRKKLGKKPHDIFAITTSRLVKKNACDDVVKALVFLPEEYHFLILGIGPDEEMLRVLARTQGVEHRVRFLGQVSHHDMPKYLRVSDVFVRPSLSEGMGNSFIEAMVAEVPVIATQEGGIADFLFDPELNPNNPPTGRAVPPRDPKAIARQIIAVIRDKAGTAHIVANAQRMVFAKYDWALIAKDMHERVFTKAFHS